MPKDLVEKADNMPKEENFQKDIETIKKQQKEMSELKNIDDTCVYTAEILNELFCGREQAVGVCV